MSYLAAAVVLVGLLGIVNLLLSFGVIRRLRQHSEQLAHQAADAAPSGPLMLGRGQSVPPVDGYTGQTLVGFFSPTCTACHERLPSFLASARELTGPSTVLAVIAGSGDPAELEAALSPVARVVTEPADGPLSTAFEVRGFPSFLLIGADRTVIGSGLSMSELPVHAAA